MKRCLMCGALVKYCSGHGIFNILYIYEQHGNGDHSNCNPLACEGANQQ